MKHLMQFSPLSYTSSFRGYIFSSGTYHQTPSIPCLGMTDQVSLPYRDSCSYVHIQLYVLCRRWEAKDSEMNPSVIHIFITGLCAMFKLDSNIHMHACVCVW